MRELTKLQMIQLTNSIDGIMNTTLKVYQLPAETLLLVEPENRKREIRRLKSALKKLRGKIERLESRLA